MCFTLIIMIFNAPSHNLPSPLVGVVNIHPSEACTSRLRVPPSTTTNESKGASPTQSGMGAANGTMFDMFGVNGIGNIL